MIPLRLLRRIERDLTRASGLLNAHYAAPVQDWDGSADDLETVRNLDTALAHIGPWISYRERHHADPYLKSLNAGSVR